MIGSYVQVPLRPAFVRCRSFHRTKRNAPGRMIEGTVSRTAGPDRGRGVTNDPLGRDYVELHADIDGIKHRL
jgi:hypothetical protein